MNIRAYIIVAVLVIAHLLTLDAAHGADQEMKVYVVYQGEYKSSAKIVIARLQNATKIRKYNTDLLQLADYTAKQKVIGKLLNSDYIILVGINTRAIFGSAINSASLVEIEDEHEALSFDFTGHMGKQNTYNLEG